MSYMQLQGFPIDSHTLAWVRCMIKADQVISVSQTSPQFLMWKSEKDGGEYWEQADGIVVPILVH